jgi:hypothetical protein
MSVVDLDIFSELGGLGGIVLFQSMQWLSVSLRGAFFRAPRLWAWACKQPDGLTAATTI